MTDLSRLELALDLLTNGQQMLEPQLEGMLTHRGFEPAAIPCMAMTIRSARWWERDRNIVGWGIAPKIAAGSPSDELSLKIYVREKLPRSGLTAEEAVPTWLELTGIGEVLTDVEEIGLVQLETLNAHLRPVPGGYSIGHPSVDGGSIGCLVHERDNPGSVFVLSCSHVLAASGTGQQGDGVLQPGPGDGGAADDALATLAHWVPFDFSPRYVNRVDAAIAGPITRAECRAEIALMGLVPRGVKPVTRGMKVQKVGRTTEHTWGAVKDAHFRTELTYPRPGGGTGEAKFLDQALCTRYSARGDSGALVLDEGGYAVGLHFAGTPLTSIFSPIQFVLDALDLELVTQSL